MPNVGVAVQAGTICFAAGARVDKNLEQEVQELMSYLGTVIPLPEKLFDAATAISGSGPGFLAVILDAFIDGGVTAGLTPAIASRLACSMMEGTARLLLETGLSAAELRHRVASPGGTTAAGIVQLEREGARSAIIDAVQAAVGRARELG
jgi:pyrroline-5-carboxylate reductase